MHFFSEMSKLISVKLCILFCTLYKFYKNKYFEDLITFKEKKQGVKYKPWNLVIYLALLLSLTHRSLVALSICCYKMVTKKLKVGNYTWCFVIQISLLYFSLLTQSTLYEITYSMDRLIGLVGKSVRQWSGRPEFNPRSSHTKDF